MKITIASGKGGTGKTMLSSNLATLLSSMMTETKVILADLDVEEPNSAIFIKGEKVKEEKKYKPIPQWIPEKCTFCNKCKEVCNFNAIAMLPENVLVFPELCHSCYACVDLCPEEALQMKDHLIGKLTHFQNDHLDFIEGELAIGEQQAVPMIAQTIDYTLENYPEKSLFIYDAPPGTSCPMIESVKDSDYVILVTEPTPFGLHDLNLSVKTMKKTGKHFGVVINRHGIGKKDVESYCKKENIPILGKIPNMEKIAKKYAKGELLLEIPEVKEELTRIVYNIQSATNTHFNLNEKFNK